VLIGCQSEDGAQAVHSKEACMGFQVMLCYNVHACAVGQDGVRRFLTNHMQSITHILRLGVWHSGPGVFLKID